MKNKQTKTLALTCLALLSIALDSTAQPSACGPPVNTGANHSIVIANFTPRLNGAPLPMGSYIIVRYDDNGVLACGGFAQWNGGNTFIAAFGDDPTTPEKDGFAVGEPFKFMVELPDSTLIEDPDIEVEYLSGGIWTDGGQFAVNGISGLSDFGAARGLLVSPIALLQGPYDTLSGLMSDALRANGLLPPSEPYSALGYANVGGGGESAEAPVFDVAGMDAIADWVFLELRDKDDATIVVATRSALLQRDGDIVEVDGQSPVFFADVPEDEYYLAVKHRNHLGVMSATPFAFSKTATVVDFTGSLNDTFGGVNGIADLGGGHFGLFSGDFDGNGQVQNTDYAAMVLTLGMAGYVPGDFDLNGQVQNTDLQLGLVINIGRGLAFGQ